MPWPVDPFPRAGLDDTTAGAQLRNYAIPSSDPEVVDGATLEFLSQLLTSNQNIALVVTMRCKTPST